MTANRTNGLSNLDIRFRIDLAHKHRTRASAKGSLMGHALGPNRLVLRVMYGRNVRLMYANRF